MRRLNEYLRESIKESIMDGMNGIAKAQDKATIQGIKNWVKSNVSKDKGRIKIDSKTGEITLPDASYINIKCPVVEGASFASFDPYSVWLTNPTESDLATICGNIDRKNEYSLRLQYIELTSFPKELDGMSGELVIDTFRKDIDFNDVNLNLQKLNLDGANVTVSGTKNINLISKRDYNFFHMENVTLKDDFGTIDVPGTDITLKNVHGKKTVFKNLKHAESLTIINCSEFDLSKCDCKYLTLEGVDESFDYGLLPKQIEYLRIETSEDYDSFDLDKIKSKVNGLQINGAAVDLKVSKEERDALHDFHCMDLDKVDEVPQRLIDYIAKNSKKVKDFDAMENGKSYLTISRSWHKEDKKYEDMSYFRNLQKVEYDRSDLNRGIEVKSEGWTASWGKDSSNKWTKYAPELSRGYGNRPTEAEPERFYNRDGGYFIDYYMIFEIPANFKPFIEKIMVETGGRSYKW